MKRKNKYNKKIGPLAKNVNPHKLAPVYKFDIERILKERQKEKDDAEKNAEYYKEIKMIRDRIKAIDAKEAKEAEEEKRNLIDKINAASIRSGLIVFDHSKYNLLFKINLNSDITNLYSQQFLKLSIEENEFEANILLDHLIEANWSPVFKDVQNIFCNWGADLGTLINRPILGQIKEEGKIGYHNFELILEYISHSILKNNKFSNNDLLTLAKFTVTISFDSHCEQMIILIKNLFSVCIEKALHADDSDSIIVFAEELYSQYTDDEIMMMVVNLFLPLKGPAMRKMYCYFTFKLFKSFIGTTNINLNAFPVDINDWFVQDLVPRKYFNKHPNHMECVIRLLEHVVFVLDLYENREKLQCMHDYMRSLLPHRIISLISPLSVTLDMWRLRLFRLHVYDIINKV